MKPNTWSIHAGTRIPESDEDVWGWIRASGGVSTAPLASPSEVMAFDTQEEAEEYAQRWRANGWTCDVCPSPNW